MQQRMLAMLAVVGIVAMVLWAFWPTIDGSRDSSNPPPLRPSAPMINQRALFDGSSIDGWKISGPSTVQNGSLHLGGQTATTATLDRLVEEDEVVTFDFFHEGARGVELVLKPKLIAPQPPDPEFIKDVVYALNTSDFVEKNWHTVTVRASHRDTNTEVKIDIQPIPPDAGGQHGGASHTMPGRGGARYQLAFKTPAGGKLQVRNIVVQERPKPLK
jgi:hypothetical protein